MVQARIDIVISILFKIGHHKLILLVGMNDIDALVSEEKIFFQLFFSVRVHLSIETNMDSLYNVLSILDRDHKLILLVEMNDIVALVS